MRKKIVLILFVFFSAVNVNAAVRDDNAISREKAIVTQSRTEKTTVTTKPENKIINSRAASVKTQSGGNISARSAAKTKTKTNPVKTIPRSAIVQSTKKTVARAASEQSATPVVETRTGVAYEQCKTSYFTCMDQFCALKNDNFRRCSCSNRIYDLEETKNVMQNANEKLTAFNEGLDSVKMTEEQATSMKVSSEGEDALTSDSSASKALLQAIMNSIKGEDSKVEGKYKSLNSIDMSFDTTNAFGMVDKGQAIAAYNGQDLYDVIYTQCRTAVKEDCNDASLQRAITAYLMSIEQDCNTVETSINTTKKQMTAAVNESTAMLGLARIENRKNHNSDDMSACLANVEKSVLSEEVCGANYHKCLDNGEFIDITTGAPITGVVDFYKLGEMLKFDANTNSADQKLSKISNNRTFVTNFETRVKKFAEPSLDKCTEDAEQVWSDYMDKALLDIYYAQKSKVDEIQQGCFDLITACYTDGKTSITSAMSSLTGDSATMLQADKIALNSAICQEYVESCSNMFDQDVIADYIDKVNDTDTLTACRTIVQDCFDDFGGSSYENFYYPSSGSFSIGYAFDWFTLCADAGCTSYVSKCAKELSKVESCSSLDMMKKAFGGFDYKQDISAITPYGLYGSTPTDFSLYAIRSTGVATEVYNQIVDILSTQCENVLGRFTQPQFLKPQMYDPDNICISTFNNMIPGSPAVAGEYNALISLYGIGTNLDGDGHGENMCPKGYSDSVDTKSWGACLCWENGARRSLNGSTAKCVAQMSRWAEDQPVGTEDYECPTSATGNYNNPEVWAWCTQTVISGNNQVCPFGVSSLDSDGKCYWSGYELIVNKIPEGI